MLKLQNVSKTYLSKGRQKVEALKDVCLEIQDRGLVFILGKSGSGKSTLLNILGGIDSATSGEIFVEDQSFKNFKQADYDNYRNSYVGFVFQEFNLLNDFDVAGNVAIALRLSGEKDISDKVANALLSVGLSEEYLTRKIDELSGGEKQRVAIARAIVKESRIILADEPTGNLDSTTGESIWNILKDLSKSKLVIVVTHDKESAQKYGDRIIEISDGKVLSDVGTQPESTEEVKTFSRQRKSLSNAVCFKMGVNNLLERKIKSVSVILLAFFTIFVILLAQVLLSFSSEKTLARLIKANGIEYIRLTQGKQKSFNDFQSSRYMLSSTADYIESNTTYIKNGIVKGKQDVLDMGLNFKGDVLDLDDNSFYLTTETLEDAYESKYTFVEIDGEAVKLIKEVHPAEFLVGKKFSFGGSKFYTVAGVVDLTKLSPNNESALPKYFSKESFEGREIHFFEENTGEVPNVTIEFGNAKYCNKFLPTDNSSQPVFDFIGAGEGKILTADGLVDDVQLADDEIALSYHMYARLFDAKSMWYYVNTDVTQVLNMPEHLGESFSFKMYSYDTGELLCDAGELKIAGIRFTHLESYGPKYVMERFTTGQKALNKIHNALNDQEYLVRVSSIKNLEKYLVDFRNKHDGDICYAGIEKNHNGEVTDYSWAIYTFEHAILLFKIIFLSIAVLLSLILLLLVINLISFSILSRKREIGILSALGATNRDITKIFLIETLLISAVTFVFGIVSIFTATAVFNSLFSVDVTLTASLLIVNVFTIITLAVASFGLLLLAALIPIRKIIKLKPIDAIKNLK
ncbi:MAG: ATP-binding cassette domain-containing protein [Clostridia bacterium]|nr:ATP-binding cassette domain-containing protein [Clostridia bacterium]